MTLKLVKNYNDEISKFIFTLRNKKYVRKNSISGKLIRFKDHQIWLKDFLIKKNIIYLIKFKKLSIGYVRLERKKNYFYVSWAILKKYQGMGLGKISVKNATKNKRFRYKALILNNNSTSKKIALGCNFKCESLKKNINIFVKN